jgi:hypothetical protein
MGKDKKEQVQPEATTTVVALESLSPEDLLAQANELLAKSDLLEAENVALKGTVTALETDKQSLEHTVAVLEAEKASLSSTIETISAKLKPSGAESSLSVMKPKAEKPSLCDTAAEVTFSDNGTERTGKFKLLVPSLLFGEEKLTAEQAIARPEVMRSLVEGTTVKGKSVFVQEIFE